MIPNPVFGVGLSSALGSVPETLALIAQADRDGLDHFSVDDHPYYGDRVDAYALLGFGLGRTEHIRALANVTNLPSRPAPMLSRTVTSLATLSGDRIILGLGAGGLWDSIVKLGVPPLGPAAAVRAFEEAIQLIRALSAGPENPAAPHQPVTFEGEFLTVRDLAPAPVHTPAIWTGSVGPKSLAVTGRAADGWIPGRASDWLSPRYRESRPIIDEAALAADRDPADIATIYNLPGLISTTSRPMTRDAEGRWRGGSVEQWVDELTGAVLEHGAAGFTYFTTGGGHADATALARWAQEIVPAVRAAVAKG
jgi:alkanesulfonate monooxygenase SsuD/methylene tetrahydromethanopterin reductase-like flavin-dependent oxidoreductase (luciferase family)